MKIFHSICILSVSFLGAASAQLISDFSENFNGSSSTLTDNFKEFDGSSADQGYTWGASVGTGGTGGISVLNRANNTFYRTGTGTTESFFDLDAAGAGSVFTLAMDMRIIVGAQTDLTVLTFGFTNDNNQSALTLTGGENLAGGIIRNGTTDYTLRMRSNSGNTATLDFAQSTLTSGNWYRLSLEATKTATTNQWNYNLGLYSIGSNGLDAPTIFNDGSKDILLTGSLNNTALYTSTAAQFAFDARLPASGTGISVLDNVSVIPEPSAVALLALAGAGGVLLRRRRNVRA